MLNSIINEFNGINICQINVRNFIIPGNLEDEYIKD